MKTVNEGIADEVRAKIVDFGIANIKKCILKLSEEQIQYRPNGNSNSVNNLVLHLNGNVRQWLIATMTDVQDLRVRDLEFDESNQKSKIELIDILDLLAHDIEYSLSNIRKINLMGIQNVQCYKETNLSILIHVIEHFSYHVGQITYITKLLLDIDTGYYAGLELTKNT